MPEHEAAERARNEAERVGAEREQGADHGIEGRKEQLVEDQRGGRAVQKEIVPLDGGADQARGRDLDMRGWLGTRHAGHCLAGHFTLPPFFLSKGLAASSIKKLGRSLPRRLAHFPCVGQQHSKVCANALRYRKGTEK